MTKLEAVKVIIQDAYTGKLKRSTLNKLRKAMTVLELSAEDQVEVEIYLEYRKRETRELWAHLLTAREARTR